MPTYTVTLPITGVLYAYDIEAESEEEAIEKAMGAPYTIQDIEEWDVHEQIVEGNVFHGHTNRASAQEEDAEE